MLHTARYLARARARELLAALAPSMFVLAERLKNGTKSLTVGPRTDVVIEGFPRSANSFALSAFLSAQPRAMSIATHTHLPVNVITGIRLGKPVLVLVREPTAAVKSFAALYIQVRRRSNPRFHLAERELAWLIKSFARQWIRFYRAVLPYRDRVVFAHFEEVKSDFGAVVERLNEKFGTAFVPFQYSEVTVREIFQNSGYHLSPSEERTDIKRRIEKANLTIGSRTALSRAEQFYRQIYPQLFGNEETTSAR